MFTRNSIRVSIFVGLLFVVPQAFAQKPSQNSDPQNKPRRVREEPDKAFKQFVIDVGPIITEAERKAWDKLQTNEEREQFIGEFWRRRDPDPDTEENEYREAYYERMSYVNEHFSSGIPGYKTDRGRIYLKYGKPDEVESHPAGGAYEREPQEGGGSTSTYPFERWFYRSIPQLSGVEIEFVDPTGTGEYRLARNPYEKEPLLMIPGAAPTMSGVSQAQIIAAASGIGNPFSMRAQDSPLEWLIRQGILQSPLPAPKYDPLGGGLIGTPKLEDNPLNFDVGFGFFKLDDHRVVTTVTVQTDNKELSFHDSGGVQVANINIHAGITNVVGRRVNSFEDAVSTTATTEELIEAKERKSAYQKAVVLAPGRYKADVLVRDTKSGAGGFRQIGFIVPKYDSNLATSSLILASVLQRITDETASRQFMIGDQKVIPNISGTFHQGSPVGVYMQIYNAAIDQTTLRPAVDVEYALMKDGRELSKQAEDWKGSTSVGERLTLSRLIDSRGLVTGDYQIEVRVKDHVSGQSLAQSAKFEIVK